MSGNRNKINSGLSADWIVQLALGVGFGFYEAKLLKDICKDNPNFEKMVFDIQNQSADFIKKTLKKLLGIKSSNLNKRKGEFDMKIIKSANDYGREVKSSHLIKSGPGAGYDVTIEGIELDNRNFKILKDEIDERYEYHDVTIEVPVKPCVAEYWSAEAYYDAIDSDYEFFDSSEDSKIEGGKAVLFFSGVDVDEGETLEDAVDRLMPSELDLTMMYGGGWSHVNLPEDGIHFDDDNGRYNLDIGEVYDYETISCDLVCPNICQDINAFFENPEEYYDDYQGDEEIESSKKIRSGYSNNPDYVGDWYGKGQIDYSKIINPEDSGDVYMVKLWSGSGYALDVYLAKAEDVYEAIDKVFKWSYENEGENEMVFDYNYLENQAADDYKDYKKHPDSWSYYGEGLSEEEFIDKWIDEAFVSDDNGLYARSENFFVDKLPEEYLNQSRKTIKSANNYGWEVDSSEVPEALDLFVEYVGKETALEEIARAMGTDVLEENLDWVIRQWGFAEDVEDMDDIWEKFEYAKEVMGTDELYENLTQAAGHDELAEDLAFIFRQYDFREWDERKGNIDSGCHGKGKGKKKGKKAIESMARSYLQPQHDARKSFYNKAETDDDKLYSYGTLVAEIVDGEPVLHDKWDYSATTIRHVKEWLQQNGFEAGTKQEIGRNYKKAEN